MQHVNSKIHTEVWNLESVELGWNPEDYPTCQTDLIVPLCVIFAVFLPGAWGSENEINK